DGDRCRGYRARNLLARPGRSLERITGTGDKSQRVLACRRCPTFAPGGLKQPPALPSRSFGRLRASMEEAAAMHTLTRKDVTAILGEPDDVVTAKITATGATLEDLAEAHAWLANDEPLMNAGRPLPSGRVARLVDTVAAITEEEEQEEIARQS